MGNAGKESAIKAMLQTEGWAAVKELILNRVAELYLSYPSANTQAMKDKIDAQIIAFKSLLVMPHQFAGMPDDTYRESMDLVREKLGGE